MILTAGTIYSCKHLGGNVSYCGNKKKTFTLPDTISSELSASSISFSALRPVVRSHVMSWLPMTFTARQPSVIEHSVTHLNRDDVVTVLMMWFISLLFE